VRLTGQDNITAGGATAHAGVATASANVPAPGVVTAPSAAAGSVTWYRTKITLRALGLLGTMADGAVTLVNPQVRAYEVLGMPAWFGFLYGIVFLVCPLAFAVFAMLDPGLIGVRPAGVEKHVARTRTLINGLTGAMFALAVLLAGRRRAHVREAWQSDLERPRDLTGECLPAATKAAYAAGFVKAGIRYRIDDAAGLWWRLADGILASRYWSRLVLISPCTTAVAVILHRSGFYGLVVNAENLIGIAGVSAGLIYGGRKARKITVKPARQKQDQT
jgi:hypothetical protein